MRASWWGWNEAGRIRLASTQTAARHDSSRTSGCTDHGVGVPSARTPWTSPGSTLTVIASTSAAASAADLVGAVRGGQDRAEERLTG